MSLKITYKDGTEETLNGYNGFSEDDSPLLKFENEDGKELHINRDIIAKIE